MRSWIGAAYTPRRQETATREKESLTNNIGNSYHIEPDIPNFTLVKPSGYIYVLQVSRKTDLISLEYFNASYQQSDISHRRPVAVRKD